MSSLFSSYFYCLKNFDFFVPTSRKTEVIKYFYSPFTIFTVSVSDYSNRGHRSCSTFSVPLVVPKGFVVYKTELIYEGPVFGLLIHQLKLLFLVLYDCTCLESLWCNFFTKIHEPERPFFKGKFCVYVIWIYG